MRAWLVCAAVVGTSFLACQATPPPLDQTALTTHAAGAAGMKGAAGANVAGSTGAAGFVDTTGASGVTGVAGVSGAGPGVAGSGPATTGVGGQSGQACGSPTLSTGKCAAGAFAHNGVCACQPDTPCVCGNQCTNILGDDDNCGACGIACGPTATCQNGKCGPAPVKIGARSAGCGTMNIAINGGNIYYTDQKHGVVATFNVTKPDAVTTIAANEASPTLIALDAVGTPYWLDAGSRSIRRWLGGTANTVTTSPVEIHGFVLSADGMAVYYSGDVFVFKVPSGGGSGAVVVREERDGIPMALALDGNRIAYPTDLNGDVDIATLTPGQPTFCGANDPATGELLPNPSCFRVARSQGSLFMGKIAAVPGRVVWADGTNLKANLIGDVQNNDNIAQAESGNISGFVVKGTSTVYFGDGNDFGGAGGVIYRAPLVKDSVPLRIARGQQAPASLALDSTRIYWTDDCQIMATVQ